MTGSVQIWVGSGTVFDDSGRIQRIPCLRIPAGSWRKISGQFLAVSGRTFVEIERNQLPKRWTESGDKEIVGTET